MHRTAIWWIKERPHRTNKNITVKEGQWVQKWDISQPSGRAIEHPKT